MSLKDGVLMAPLTLPEVAGVLEEKNYDLAVVGGSPNINQWAAFKPNNGEDAELRDLTSKGNPMLRGMKWQKGSSWREVPNLANKITYINSAPYHLAHFHGYDHAARFPINAEGKSAEAYISGGENPYYTANIAVPRKTELGLEDLVDFTAYHCGLYLVHKKSGKTWAFMNSNPAIYDGKYNVSVECKNDSLPSGEYTCYPVLVCTSDGSSPASGANNNVEMTKILDGIYRLPTDSFSCNVIRLTITVSGTISDSIVTIRLTANHATTVSAVTVTTRHSGHSFSRSIMMGEENKRAAKSVALTANSTKTLTVRLTNYEPLEYSNYQIRIKADSFETTFEA